MLAMRSTSCTRWPWAREMDTRVRPSRNVAHCQGLPIADLRVSRSDELEEGPPRKARSEERVSRRLRAVVGGYQRWATTSSMRLTVRWGNRLAPCRLEILAEEHGKRAQANQRALFSRLFGR